MDSKTYENILNFKTQSEYERRFPEGYTKNKKDALRKRCKSYEVEGGLLYYKHGNNELLEVPTKEKVNSIMRSAHVDNSGNHFGRDKTIRTVRLTHYWPGFTNDVKEFCKICEICQRNRSNMTKNKEKRDEKRQAAQEEQHSAEEKDCPFPFPDATEHEKKFRLQSNEDEGCFAEETAGNHSQENTEKCSQKLDVPIDTKRQAPEIPSTDYADLLKGDQPGLSVNPIVDDEQLNGPEEAVSKSIGNLCFQPTPVTVLTSNSPMQQSDLTLHVSSLLNDSNPPISALPGIIQQETASRSNSELCVSTCFESNSGPLTERMDTCSETTAGQQQSGEVYDTNQQTNIGYGDKSPSPLTVEEALKGFEGEETPSHPTFEQWLDQLADEILPPQQFLSSSGRSNPDAAPLPPSKRLHIEEGESTVPSSKKESQAETLQHGTVSSAQEVVTNDVGQPLNRSGEVVGGQPLNRSGEVVGGQPLSRNGEVAQSPSELWQSGCNRMGQMHVNNDPPSTVTPSPPTDDDPPSIVTPSPPTDDPPSTVTPSPSTDDPTSTVTPSPPTDDPPSTVTPSPPTDDLTTIQHKIPSTPAVLAALDDCKRANEMTYPKLVSIKVPIGSEMCAEEGLVHVPVRFPSHYLSLKQLVDQCLANHDVPPNGGFAVVQAVFHLVQLLKDVHDKGYSCYGTIAGLQDLYMDKETFSSIRHPVTVLCVANISRLNRYSGLDPYSRESRVREGKLWDIKALLNIIDQVLSMAVGYQIHVSEMLKGNLIVAGKTCEAARDDSYMALVHEELAAQKRVCVVQFAPNENYQEDHIVCLEKEKINDVVLKWLLKNNNGVTISLVDADHKEIHIGSSEVYRLSHRVAAVFLPEAPPPPPLPSPLLVPQGTAVHPAHIRHRPALLQYTARVQPGAFQQIWSQPMSVQPARVQPGTLQCARGKQEVLAMSSTSQYVPVVAMGRSAVPLNGGFHPSPNPLTATSFSSPHPPRGPAIERPLRLLYTACDPQTGTPVRASHTPHAHPMDIPTQMCIQPLLAPHDPSHTPTSESTTAQATTSSHLNSHLPSRH